MKSTCIELFFQVFPIFILLVLLGFCSYVFIKTMEFFKVKLGLIPLIFCFTYLPLRVYRLIYGEQFQLPYFLLFVLMILFVFSVVMLFLPFLLDSFLFQTIFLFLLYLEDYFLFMWANNKICFLLLTFFFSCWVSKEESHFLFFLLVIGFYRHLKLQFIDNPLLEKDREKMEGQVLSFKTVLLFLQKVCSLNYCGFKVKSRVSWDLNYPELGRRYFSRSSRFPKGANQGLFRRALNALYDYFAVGDPAKARETGVGLVLVSGVATAGVAINVNRERCSIIKANEKAVALENKGVFEELTEIQLQIWRIQRTPEEFRTDEAKMEMFVLKNKAFHIITHNSIANFASVDPLKEWYQRGFNEMIRILEKNIYVRLFIYVELERSPADIVLQKCREFVSTNASVFYTSLPTKEENVTDDLFNYSSVTDTLNGVIAPAPPGYFSRRLSGSLEHGSDPLDSILFLPALREQKSGSLGSLSEEQGAGKGPAITNRACSFSKEKSFFFDFWSWWF